MTTLHAEGLLAAADRETFAHMPNGPGEWSAPGFAGYIDTLLAHPAVHPFVVLDTRTGTPVGVTSYYDVRPEHRGLSIGYTWLGPAARGTPINPQAKRLLMAHAFETPIFDTGPAIRVQLKTDARNERSQRAMARLGFTLEGTLRNHMVLPDGRRRDSVIFSVTETDWPRVRDTLDARISALAR